MARYLPKQPISLAYKKLIVIRILIILSMLSACSGGGYRAPVSDRVQPPSDKIQYHIVAKGETLFSISWRYGLDYKALAQANGISSNYKIYPGQRLNLKATPAQKTSSSSPAPVSVAAKSRPEDQTITRTKTPPHSQKSGSLTWRWPANGRVYEPFSSTKVLKKGVDILGEKGESVLAASSGYVVYAGEGLRGYGKLLIIKHNDVYLSAYAHNNRLLVKEGDKVKAGQKIAEIGSSGTVRNMLHFEIRKNGVPVDPERYLPRRNY